MRIRRKKRYINYAVIFMIVATICLSSIQFGFSFLNQKMFLGGIGYIQSSPSSSNALELITNSNSGFVVNDFSSDPTTDAANLGYELILRGSINDSLNNYIKFSENANELWRIVGWTKDGIKIVKDEYISAENGVYWDSDESHWVELDMDQTLPYAQKVGSLTNASTMCQYLNTTYYNALTDPTNINYINPSLINHSATWDITPMNVQSGAPSYVAGMTSGYITAQAVVSSSFIGLPIGLLSVTERCLLSSSFSSAQGNLIYKTLFDGWLNSNVDNEMTITERVQENDMDGTTSFSTSQALFTQDNKISNSNKASNGREYRPVMYLYSDIVLSNGTGTGNNGSITNPFIVTGRGL